MTKLGGCGAEVRPISHEGRDGQHLLEKVVIESDRPGARGPVNLSPAQALYVEERLTHIALDFLHDRGWGGEDARSQ